MDPGDRRGEACFGFTCFSEGSIMSSNWLKKRLGWASGSAHRAPRRADAKPGRPRPLRLEALEDRCLMSTGPGVVHNEAGQLRWETLGASGNFSSYLWGPAGGQPAVGNWSGPAHGADGTGVAEWAGNGWHLMHFLNSGGSGARQQYFYYPQSNVHFLAGNWAGNGVDGVAVTYQDPNTSYLDWDFYTIGSDRQYHLWTQLSYGGGNWTPVVGDWTGRGFDSIGVVDGNSYWYELNINAPVNRFTSYGVNAFGYGWAGTTPVVGDWTGRGYDTIGIFVPGAVAPYNTTPGLATWLLRYSNSSGGVDHGFAYGGASGYTPVPGNWDGSGGAPGAQGSGGESDGMAGQPTDPVLVQTAGLLQDLAAAPALSAPQGVVSPTRAATFPELQFVRRDVVGMAPGQQDRGAAATEVATGSHRQTADAGAADALFSLNEDPFGERSSRS
jgi:hypothetical protein